MRTSAEHRESARRLGSPVTRALLLLLPLAMLLLGGTEEACAARTKIARVEVIVVDKVREDLTDTVKVTALGKTRGNNAYLGMPLHESDGVSSADATATIKIVASAANGKEISYTLTGPFRVAISRPRDGRIIMDLRAGSIYIESDAPTKVRVGEQVAASEATSYSVHVTEDGASPGVETVVYEGAVKVNPGCEQESQRVTEGEKLVGGVTEPANKVKACGRDFDRAARARAEVDAALLSRSGCRIDPAAESRLQSAYRASLAAPLDIARSLNLSAVKLDLGILPGVGYLLGRTRVSRTEQPALWKRRTMLAAEAGARSGHIAPADLDDFAALCKQPGCRSAKRWPHKAERFLQADIARRRGFKELHAARWEEARASLEAAARAELARGKRTTSATELGLAITIAHDGDASLARRYARNGFAQFDRTAADVAQAHVQAAWTLTAASVATAFVPAQPWLARMMELEMAQQALLGFGMRQQYIRPDARDLYGRGVLMYRLSDGQSAGRILREALILNRRTGGLEASETAHAVGLIESLR